jgi:thiosulfate dehydrogenase [quinone] large subunit
MTVTGRGSAAHLEHVEAPGSMLTKNAAKALAVLRMSTGFVFLWAFFDKTFGWGFATPSARAWINGGSPTKGFLSGVDVGPGWLQTFFHNIAGDPWADWLFMLGLLAIGAAFILGIGMRIAAGAGVAMMAMMWLAEFPLDKTTSAGKPSMSTNPITDYHFIYAVTGVVLALTYAGHTWGLGRWWASLPIVQKYRWLI